MLFTQDVFLLVFLPVVWAAYAIALRGFGSADMAVRLLGLASLIFYAYDSIWNAGLMLISIGVNFLIGRRIALERETSLARPLLVVGVVFNLLLLGFFKYTGFVVENLNAVGLSVGQLPRLLLPLGISFYTFTQIAFLVDSRSRDLPAPGFRSYFLFVSFFPHLIAGPIIHHAQVIPQFQRLKPDAINLDTFSAGLVLFAIGLMKKVILADTYAPWVEGAYWKTDLLGTADAWILSLSYTLQLYFDFSGYCDMAVGLSLLFGIRLPYNFDSPYKSSSVGEFWRHWHMTLSRWLRDYVYIPMGGNRGGVSQGAARVLVTFLVGGLWHGAGWTFIIWGALHGIAVAIERFWTALGLVMPRLAGVILTFLFVNAAWVFFRAPNVDAALEVLRAMAGGSAPGLGTPYFADSSMQIIPWIAAGLAIVWFLPNSQQMVFAEPAQRTSFLFRGIFSGAAIGFAALMNNGGVVSPFLYFKF